MKQLILRLEPLIWFLFGSGFLVGCMLFPAYILAVGIAAPLGWLPPEAIAFERVSGLAASGIGRVVLLAMIVFPAWNGLNHFRHFLIDLGSYQRDRILAPLLYGIALVVSLVAVVAIVRL